MLNIILNRTEEFETSTSILMLEDMLFLFLSIMLKDTKKRMIEDKGNFKTFALRKGLKEKSNKLSVFGSNDSSNLDSVADVMYFMVVN